jgi:hypothetical protein
MNQKHTVTVELGKSASSQLMWLADKISISESQVMEEALWWYFAWDELGQNERDLISELAERKAMTTGAMLKRALHFYAAFAKFSDMMKVFDDSIE